MTASTTSATAALAHLTQPATRIKFTTLALMSFSVMACLLLDICLGSIAIPLDTVLNVLVGNPVDNAAHATIIQSVRIPKAFTAMLVGMALSVSGLQMQTLFRNPLAGPSVFGITAGASLAIAMLMLGGGGGGVVGAYSIRQLGLSGSSLIITASCLGSATVMLAIMGVALKIRDNVVLLIIGFLFSSVVMSLVSIWQYFSSPEALQEYIIWTLGSLSGVSNDQLWILTPVVLTGIAFTFATSKYLNLLLMGENYAASMGVNIVIVKAAIIASTSLLAGAITGFCGPIGLIGVAIPHLCRALLNTSDHRILIPACCLVGANVMLLCDVISQLPSYQAILPINPVTSLLGAPVVIWVIVKRNNLRQSF